MKRFWMESPTTRTGASVVVAATQPITTHLPLSRATTPALIPFATATLTTFFSQS